MARAPKKISKIKIVLGSASSRRRELLAPFCEMRILLPTIDESERSGESPRSYVERIAREKWKKILRDLPKNSNELIVCADTTVACQKQILGKPLNKNDCLRMMKILSGKTHDVWTAVAIGLSFSIAPQVFCVQSRVRFRRITTHELTDYIRFGDWQGKAGAYAIQGDAAQFVDSVRGSITNIIGLPVSETIRALAQIDAQRRS